MSTRTVTITIDDDWQAEIDNYNEHKRKAKAAMSNETHNERATRKAGAAFSSASMSLGWKIARELKRAGIEIEP